MALKKLCPRCNKLIEYWERHCAACAVKVEEQQAQRHKVYDKYVRHSKENRIYAEFYHSKEWEQTRAHVINLYSGIDLYAYYILKKIVPATTVHHIRELKEDWDIRLDLDNLFPVSENNHKRIHALYRKDKAGTQKMLKELMKQWAHDTIGQGGGQKS